MSGNSAVKASASPPIGLGKLTDKLDASVDADSDAHLSSLAQTCSWDPKSEGPYPRKRGSTCSSVGSFDTFSSTSGLGSRHNSIGRDQDRNTGYFSEEDNNGEGKEEEEQNK